MSEQTKARRRTERRPAAEWVTLAVSVAIVAGLIGLVSLQFGPDREVQIEVTARTAEARETAGLHYLPIDVVNRGDRTALDVVVRVASGEETVDVAFDVIWGGGSVEARVVLRSPPRAVEARALSFRVP